MTEQQKDPQIEYTLREAERITRLQRAIKPARSLRVGMGFVNFLENTSANARKSLEGENAGLINQLLTSQKPGDIITQKPDEWITILETAAQDLQKHFKLADPLPRLIEIITSLFPEDRIVVEYLQAVRQYGSKTYPEAK